MPDAGRALSWAALGGVGVLFIELLRQFMQRRKEWVRLILDDLPAHIRSIVRDCVASMNGRLNGARTSFLVMGPI